MLEIIGRIAIVNKTVIVKVRLSHEPLVIFVAETLGAFGFGAGITGVHAAALGNRADRASGGTALGYVGGIGYHFKFPQGPAKAYTGRLPVLCLRLFLGCVGSPTVQFIWVAFGVNYFHNPYI